MQRPKRLFTSGEQLTQYWKLGLKRGKLCGESAVENACVYVCACVWGILQGSGYAVTNGPRTSNASMFWIQQQQVQVLPCAWNLTWLATEKLSHLFMSWICTSNVWCTMVSHGIFVFLSFLCWFNLLHEWTVCANTLKQGRNVFQGEFWLKGGGSVLLRSCSTLTSKQRRPVGKKMQFCLSERKMWIGAFEFSPNQTSSESKSVVMFWSESPWHTHHLRPQTLIVFGEDLLIWNTSINLKE